MKKENNLMGVTRNEFEEYKKNLNFVIIHMNIIGFFRF